MKLRHLLVVLLLVSTYSYAQQHSQVKPAGIAPSHTMGNSASAPLVAAYPSSRRNFEVQITDSLPTTLNTIVSWPIKIKSLRANYVLDEVKLMIDGGMPHHGHGLPTTPTIKPTSKPDEYIIEGLKFSMPGYWEVRINASNGQKNDNVTIGFKIDR